MGRARRRPRDLPSATCRCGGAAPGRRSGARLLLRLARAPDRRRVLAAALDQPPLRARRRCRRCNVGRLVRRLPRRDARELRAACARGRVGGGRARAAAARRPVGARQHLRRRTRTTASTPSRRRRDRPAASPAARSSRAPPGGRDDAPPVRIFVMGENRWRDEDDWPLARARGDAWYLHAPAGVALAGAARRRRRPTQYVYDPNDPAPTVGGPTSLPGPDDENELRPARPARGRGRATTSSSTPRRRSSSPSR